MYQDHVQTVERYFAELVTGGDFADIAMRDDVHFTGPMATATNAVDYRSMCEEFAESIRDISIRTLVGNDEVIHAVYDVDMGLPTGPLLISQTFEFADDAFASVEVIFDAAVVAGVAA